MKNTTSTTPAMRWVEDALQNAMSYSYYREWVAQLVAQESNSGPEKTEALYQYTLLNDSRMRRLDKTTKIPEHIAHAFSNFDNPQIWLVLTESWCGDAAQSMPVMHTLAEMAPRIDFKVALRDENEKLMDAFLTNGSRSIPKLIVIDKITHRIVNSWGPRPSKATAMVEAYKKEHGGLSPQFKQDLQVWYNKDKGENIATDLWDLIR